MHFERELFVATRDFIRKILIHWATWEVNFFDSWFASFFTTPNFTLLAFVLRALLALWLNREIWCEKQFLFSQSIEEFLPEIFVQGHS